jgi:uncharacterized protein (TIGR02231 family)
MSAGHACAEDIGAKLLIDKVTVYREGAVVTRSGPVAIPAGTHRLIIKGLPAGVDPKSLHIALDSRAIQLGGIDVATINEGKFVSEAERGIRHRIEELGDQRQALQDEVSTAQLQLKLLDALATTPAGNPTKPTVDAANLGAVLTTMSSTSMSARRHLRESNVRLRELDRTLETLKADLAKVATQSKQSTEVITSVEAGSAATPNVSVSYGVADAGWEWVYEARLDTAKKRVSLQRQGAIENHSGENWNNVELTLTTATPSDDASTPEVGSLFVNLEEPQRLEMRAKAAKASAAATIAATPVAVPEVAVTGARRTAQVSATDYLAEYTVPGRVTVIADRQPRLYPIAENSFDVALVARVVPSAGHVAHLEATFTYELDVPVEGGELQLYRDGAFVGEAATKPFLPGAEIRLPFGNDEKIRVAVHDEPSQSAERGLISRQLVKETRRRFEITNYHPAPIPVEVIDRLPVSQNADVHVEVLKGATDPTIRALDGRAGVLLWRLNALPRKPASINHYYSVEFPRDRRLMNSEEGVGG